MWYSTRGCMSSLCPMRCTDTAADFVVVVNAAVGIDVVAALICW